MSDIVYVACRDTECDYGCDTTDILGVFSERQDAENHCLEASKAHSDEHTFRVEEHELHREARR